MIDNFFVLFLKLEALPNHLKDRDNKQILTISFQIRKIFFIIIYLDHRTPG